MLIIYSSLSFFSSHFFTTLFFSFFHSSSSSNTAMEPKHPNEEIFRKFVYASLIDKGYERTAEEFRNDTQLTEPVLDEPPGFLLDFWNSFYEMYNFRQNQQPSSSSTGSQVIVHQPSNTSTQSQVIVEREPLDIGPLMNTTTAQRIWDEAPVLHHSSSVMSNLESPVVSGASVNVENWDYPTNRVLNCGPDLQREIEVPKRFDLSPSLKDLLKRNVRDFAAVFRANTKLQLQAKANLPGYSVMSNLDSPVASGADVAVDPRGHSQFPDNQDAVNSVLNKYGDLNLDEYLEFASEDQKDEVIASWSDQMVDLKKQTKERKEWALERALQAAKKLSDHMSELQTLRTERDLTPKREEALEDTTMKKLSMLESHMRSTNVEMDRASEDFKRLETENAEIRAEMEASKLSASESVTACLEVEKKEKQLLKKLAAWEKQKAKLQKEVSNLKEKISEAQQVLAQTSQRQNEAEAKWKEELKAQEDASALVAEEYQAKETAKSNIERGLEELRRKIGIDLQRRKDDLRRLEDDLSSLKASVDSAKLLRDLSEKEANRDRECIMCMKDEVSVVFFPCAHEIICAKCSEEYGKEGNASCPFCQVKIEKRVRVFGGGS